jgi:hypothetical protein
MTKYIAALLIIWIPWPKNHWTDRACEVLNMVLPVCRKEMLDGSVTSLNEYATYYVT